MADCGSPPRGPPRACATSLPLVPEDVDPLAFAVLVLESINPRRVHLTHSRDIVGPLVFCLFVIRPYRVERLKLPPGMLL